MYLYIYTYVYLLVEGLVKCYLMVQQRSSVSSVSQMFKLIVLKYFAKFHRRKTPILESLLLKL